MRSMEIDRRDLLRGLAGGFIGSQLPVPLCAAVDRRIYLSACTDASGRYRVRSFSPHGAQVFDLPLPARGHSFATHPVRPVAVHFARRPHRFAYVVDLARGIIVNEFATPGNRHFYGHGVFSHDGHLLYASENDFEGQRGVIGVYDAKDNYRRAGELNSHGTGPHDIQLLSDGDTLVVANGGISTRPELPRMKLNLPTMAPSLCYIDRYSGRLLRKHLLNHTLHQLSIRHLAISRDNTVAIAMQYEGPAGDLVPLVALCRARRIIRGAQCHDSLLHLLEGPPDVLRSMKRYCGSVCFDSSARIIAVSAPRGNLVTFWGVDAGAYLLSTRVADGSGIAPGRRAGEFLASSGQGGVVVIDAWSGETRPLKAAFLKASCWDNHLAVATLV